MWWEGGRQRPQPTPEDPHQALRHSSRPEPRTWGPREHPPETLTSAGRRGGVQPSSATSRKLPGNHPAGGSFGPSSGAGTPGGGPRMNPGHDLEPTGRVSHGILTGFGRFWCGPVSHLPASRDASKHTRRAASTRFHSRGREATSRSSKARLGRANQRPKATQRPKNHGTRRAPRPARHGMG